MSYRDRDFDHGRGSAMDWGDQGNGYRGQFSRQDRFGGWNAEEPEYYGDQDFRGQERYGDQFGDQYSQGGYGQDYGRQATDWQGRQFGGQRSFGPRGGWEQNQMGSRGYRDESQFGRGRGRGAGYSMGTFGGGQPYGRGDFRRSGGWPPYGEPGWGAQGRGGSWDQDWDWEQGASGRGHWGQGYSDQGMMGQNESRQRIAGPGYGGQGRPGGTFYYEEIWLIPGPHSGRGPRGYQRNDQRIEEDICERLTQHGQIDAEDIQVKVKNGEVTLTGTVDSRQSKRMAEDALDSVSGIKDVHNQLRVQQSEGQGRSRSDQDQLIGQTQMGDAQGSTGSSRGQSRNQSRRTETTGVGASSS
jgi:hypothetical protein